MMGIATPDLAAAIRRIHAGIHPISDEMNALDGKLGDGDLGVTILIGFDNMMTAGKQAKDQTEFDEGDIPALLETSQAAMIARDGASLGDKTSLDSMDAIIKALNADASPDGMLERAEQAAQCALTKFNNKPNKIGRASIFGDKTIGMDDPGMVAVLRLISLMR